MSDGSVRTKGVLGGETGMVFNVKTTTTTTTCKRVSYDMMQAGDMFMFVLWDYSAKIRSLDIAM